MSLIKSIIRSYIINLAVLAILSQYIGGIHITSMIPSLFIIALSLTALHTVVKLLLDTILGSLNFLTLGILGLILDSAVLYGLSRYFPQLEITAWHFPGLTAQNFSLPPYDLSPLLVTIFAALTINIVRTIVNSLV